MAGVQLTKPIAWVGTAVVQGDGHQWIRVWDGYRNGAADGWTKEVFAKAQLDAPYQLSDGSIPAGTPVVLIGDDLAILLEQDVELTPKASSDDDIAEAIEMRDSEWIAHLTPD